jgi:hypothetical protein
MERHLLPLHLLQKVLPENLKCRDQCFKNITAEGYSNYQFAVMFMVTQHGLLIKGPSQTFTNNTFIADSGATCHMRGSQENMFDLKLDVIDIMVGNN